MKNKITIFLIFIIISLSARLFAAFKDNGWGARPSGMGGAFTAVADDANAPLYNPAGIMQLKSPEGSFMYSRLYTGLDGVNLGLNYLAYVHPTATIGSFGINWANFVASDLYREDTVTLSYAHSLNDFYEELENEYLVGANIKYLRNSFTLDERSRVDPVFSGGKSADAYALDLGFMVNFYEESLGFSIKNINEPDVGLRTREVVHREYRAGFAYFIGNFWKIEEALAAVDGSFRNDIFEYHIGWENWFAHRTFALRFGTNSDEVDMGFGYVQDLGASGISLEFNYALLWPLEIDDTTGSHRVSLTMRFPGRVKPELAVSTDKETEMEKEARKIVTGAEVKEEERGLVVNLSTQVLFDTARAIIKTRAIKVLDEVAELLAVYGKNDVIIEGHCDSIGTMILNQRLSENRANAVFTYFAKKGIALKRMRAFGYGETRPVSSNKTREGRTQNRRVEVIIIKLTSQKTTN